ncbi:hypothetical protein [Mycolicibacterium sp. CBMA 361]|uniref:Lhr family helicase n=1 Tax=Mycolicibacterium sp. CBMA 361 TaxID=2606610 RepID=UPI0031BB3D78
MAPGTEIEFTGTHRELLDTLGNGGAYFFRQLAPEDSADAKRALWELIWAGWVTGDTFAPVRAILGNAGRKPGGAHRQRQRPPRLSRYSVARPQARTVDPTVAGRWSALPPAEPESTVRAHFQAELLLNRYGVVTRGAADGLPGGFATLYKVLTAFEEAGRCQPWPEVSGHRPGRKAGALVALVDGELVWFLERGGKSLLAFDATPEQHRAAAGALSDLVSAGRLQSLLIEKVNGEPVLAPTTEADRAVVHTALADAGFSRTPRGLRLR